MALDFAAAYDDLNPNDHDDRFYAALDEELQATRVLDLGVRHRKADTALGPEAPSAGVHVVLGGLEARRGGGLPGVGGVGSIRSATSCQV
jgi:hypothetical protein